MFSLQESKQGQILKIQEAFLAFFVIAICFTVYMVGVSIDNLIEINGAVIGFFFIYFLPALLHMKCLYFCTGNKEEEQKLK